MRKRVLYSILSIASVIVIFLNLKNTIYSEIEAYTSLSQVSAAVGTEDEEEIIHTHIWATKYDNVKHWEYCTICNKVRNDEEHNCVDNWFYGYESCNYQNYSTRICECGYNYIYHKSHVDSNDWRNTGIRMVHYKNCKSCGTWTASGRCYDDEGVLGCNNPGTCKVCNYTANEDCHCIVGTKDKAGNRFGKCRFCNKIFFKVSSYTISYAEDYKTAIVKFSFIPMDDSVEFTGSMGAYCGDVNYTSNKWTYVKHEDGTCDYTGVYTFDKNKQRKSNLSFLDRTGAIKVNGVSLYMDGGILNMQIWQDHEAPRITEVIQGEQAKSKDWATIKELTIIGEEDLSKIVTISIKDKLTNEVIVKDVKTNVVKGEYKYKCTPPIEGSVEGREYILTVKDEVGNAREHIFTVYRTDSRAPMIKDDDFTEWSKSKLVDIKLTDYGSGGVQVSLDNQYSYKTAIYKADGYYHVYYTFTEENYGIDTHVLYLKDDLGNAVRTWIKVGRIDKNKPSIKSINNNKVTGGVNVVLTGDDYSSRMKEQGAGVAYYAITKTTDKNPTSWSTSNIIKITEPNIYFLWAKDRAGNICDVRRIIVNEEFDVISEDEIITDAAIVGRERGLHRYFLHDENAKNNLYLKDNTVSILMFGELNNDENMYMFLSNSKDTLFSQKELGSYLFDIEDLWNILRVRSKMLKFEVHNSREILRFGGIYFIKANNLCTISLPNNIENIMKARSYMPIYLHIVGQNKKERVIDLFVLKRAVFNQR